MDRAVERWSSKGSGDSRDALASINGSIKKLAQKTMKWRLGFVFWMALALSSVGLSMLPQYRSGDGLESLSRSLPWHEPVELVVANRNDRALVERAKRQNPRVSGDLIGGPFGATTSVKSVLFFSVGVLGILVSLVFLVLLVRKLDENHDSVQFDKSKFRDLSFVFFFASVAAPVFFGVFVKNEFFRWEEAQKGGVLFEAAVSENKVSTFQELLKSVKDSEDSKAIAVYGLAQMQHRNISYMDGDLDRNLSTSTFQENREETLNFLTLNLKDMDRLASEGKVKVQWNPAIVERLEKRVHGQPVHGPAWRYAKSNLDAQPKVDAFAASLWWPLAGTLALMAAACWGVALRIKRRMFSLQGLVNASGTGWTLKAP